MHNKIKEIYKGFSFFFFVFFFLLLFVFRGFCLFVCCFSNRGGWCGWVWGPGVPLERPCSDDAVGGAADGPQVHAVLHVVLLQLGQDVLAVGVLAQRGDVGPDLRGKQQKRPSGT